MKFQLSCAVFITLFTFSTSFQVSPLSHKCQNIHKLSISSLVSTPAVSTKSTCLYNVPPPSVDDPDRVKDAADREGALKMAAAK